MMIAPFWRAFLLPVPFLSVKPMCRTMGKYRLFVALSTRFRMAILSMNSDPQEASAIQSQIFNEARSKSRRATAASEHFLASCFALGVGTDADMKESVAHLEQAYQLGHMASFLILDRLTVATGYYTDQQVQLRLPGSWAVPSLDYDKRVRQTKAMHFRDGHFMGTMMSKRKPQLFGFRRPRARTATDELKGIDDGTVSELLRNFASLESNNDTTVTTVPMEALDPALVDFGITFAKFALEHARLQETSGASACDQPLLDAVNSSACLDSSSDSQHKTLQLIEAALQAEGHDKAQLERTTPYGDTPLLLACRNGQTLGVRHLLSVGADASAVNTRGLTPLHWLGFFGDDALDIALLLASSGAPLNARTSHHVDLEEHCFYLPPGCTPLHFAVGMRNLGAVQALVRLGADLSVTVPVVLAFHHYYMTPLHFAICLHFHEIVEGILITMAQVPSVDVVLFRKRIDAVDQIRPISAFHLVGVPLFMQSSMAPFARWILHGSHSEKAAEKTISCLLEAFPRKDVLELLRHPLSNVAWPVTDRYIWRAFKKFRIGPKRIAPGGVEGDGQLPEAAIAFCVNPSHPVESWVVAALLGSTLAVSSTVAMEMAISEFGEPELRFEPGFLLQAVGYCAATDLVGSFSVLIKIRRVREALTNTMPLVFWLAACHNAVGIMQIIWDVFVRGAGISRDRHVWASACHQCGFMRRNKGMLTSSDTQRKVYLDFVHKNMTPLHGAAQRNAASAVRFLIKNGASLDFDIRQNGTPLYMAASSSAKESALLLLDSGAKINCCRARGDSYNVLHASVAAPDMVIKRSRELPLARSHLQTHHAGLVSDLRNTLSSRDIDGQTPLHTAVVYCDVATVTLLLELIVESGNTNLLALASETGVTPLMSALLRQHFNSLLGGVADLEKNVATAAREQDTGDHIWLGKQAGLIARMLIDAGSPLPEEEEMTGAPMFILNAVVDALFTVSPSTLDFGIICASAFGKFSFMQRPSPRTGLPARVLVAPGPPRRIIVYPDGFFQGAPVIVFTNNRQHNIWSRWIFSCVCQFDACSWFANIRHIFNNSA
ncbi:ankyrin [Thozetella sp. PMI_491]|nr:ankyrin [Thozetella sp. PMI_491]